MGLFEKDFGPDLIGDMFTNVCLAEIIEFNERIIGILGLKPADFELKLANGSKHSARILENPTQAGKSVPIILLPMDILRDLPVAVDWRGVQQVSERNSEFRGRLNDDIATLWSKRTLESKSKLKTWALSSQQSFSDLLDLIHGMEGEPYDFGNDKLGELVWRNFANDLVEKFPLELEKPDEKSQPELARIVDKILEQFTFLIEDRDLWRDLYSSDGKPRLEKAAQRFLYMTALSYCDANNIDMTPEADTGRGPVDFKFSRGSDARLLVEIKLSRNPKLVHGFEKQLALYNRAENAFDSRYVIVDVGGMGRKLKRIQRVADELARQGKRHPKVLVIDGQPKISASKA